MYELWLGRFLEYAEMTPDEFYKFHLDAINSEDIRDTNATRRLLKEYVVSIEDKYKPATQAQVTKAVQSFITAQGFRKIEMNHKKKRIFHHGAENYKAEEFKRAIGGTTARNRAACLVTKDSGLRVSDVVRLNVGDVRTDEDFIIMDISVEKTGFPSKPCLGPDALDSVREYLTTREDPKDSDPLFIQTQHAHRGERMTASALASRIKMVGKVAGFDKMSSNSFRKWNTTSLQSWINPIWLNMLQGRSMPTESVAHYSLPTDEQLLTAYRENYDKLRFYKAKISKSEVNDLKTKYAATSARLDEMEPRYQALANMVAELTKKLEKYEEKEE